MTILKPFFSTIGGKGVKNGPRPNWAETWSGPKIKKNEDRGLN